MSLIAVNNIPSAQRGHGYATGCQQLGQPNKAIGRGGQREHPADARAAAMTDLAKAGDGLAPAKHFLDAFAQPPTDRIAGMARRPRIDGRSPVGDVLCHMRRHLVLPQIADELADVAGLIIIGTQRDRRVPRRAATLASAESRSAVPVAWVSRASTTPEHAGFPSKHQNMPQIGQLGRLARPLAVQPVVGSSNSYGGTLSSPAPCSDLA
jgi:hypothetical protein